ncbi:M50 family metallopeptidase [Nostoc spongiaeforme FACHB-130]|uniref:M50 family metallopeptidase n=1 Tax=Nostoc spongiaeforme FACHB-130 TaxID=1357510 RepID=A0ABR8FPX8_9NOSO|nr:site-2 protease family protein [Nostoc spongiaeforme]MBD2593199.1 M50 family metallopeptidase [Nostoc spongiaeforme FACHB-130]
MNLEENSNLSLADCQTLVCPNLKIHWQILPVVDSDKVFLQAIKTDKKLLFSATEGYALKHFDGTWTVKQVQKKCQQKFGESIDSNFIMQLLNKLADLQVLAIPKKHNINNLTTNSQTTKAIKLYRLKSAVQWIWHTDGYWLIRLQNTDNLAYFQVSNYDKNLIIQLSKLPVETIIAKYKINPQYLQELLQRLALKGMLEGIEPPKYQKKFSLLQILYFKFRLFNPDNWLNVNINKFRFIFTAEFCFLLCLFLGFTTVIAFARQETIYNFGQELWKSQGFSLIIPFALLMMFVVSIHELGHAFTLKHYKGVVLDIGLMFICLLPGAYTNTTDAYGLVKRKQRALVMAAGVICQVVIWGIALCLWSISPPVNWFYIATYLLMLAAQFTLVINLNPLNKFDGYYLLEAMTGINHLRQRSFAYYAQLWRREPSQERTEDIEILVVYAPACLLYITWLVINLFFWIWHLYTPFFQ